MPLDTVLVDAVNRVSGASFNGQNAEDRKTLKLYWRVLSKKYSLYPISVEPALRAVELY